MSQKSATEKQKEREVNYKKLESNEISEQIILKHYCRAKNCANLGKPCYTEGSIHIPLTSDHVKRWVDYVLMEKATVYEPPCELRKPWVEGYHQKQQLKKGRKKKQAEADGPSNPSPTLPPTQAGYMQNPMGLTNLPMGLGNFMYPANISGMGLGGLGLNSPNIILQTSLQPPAQLMTHPLNSTQQVQPSSPLSAGAEPLKRLEEYVQWHVSRTPSRAGPFNHAYSELKGRMYEFTDLSTISREEWAEMGVLGGISKALKRDMKKYQRSLHDVESGSNNDS
jgi:hypothetical protein